MKLTVNDIIAILIISTFASGFLLHDLLSLYCDTSILNTIFLCLSLIIMAVSGVLLSNKVNK